MNRFAAIIAFTGAALAWASAPADEGAPVQTPAEIAASCAANAANGAVAVCEKAARANPDDPAVQRNLARSYIAIADFDSAVEVYRKVASARPDDARAQADFGGTLAFVRRYVEAIAPMEAVMRLRPRDIAAHRAAAVVYMQLRRHSDALRVTRKAAELGDPIAMFDLSGFYRDGTGTAADQGQALEWAARAAERGHLGALDLMVRVYLDGLMGEAVDEEKAAAWAWKFRNARLAPGGAPQR